MATYKVIQDIEAEDKILGPLTLRQFIYALITAFLLYICFICIAKHLAYLTVLFLPPALFTGFFAFPFTRDQPTEVWALAKIRFLFKPRRRIWDQSGVKELVTITAPKKIETVLTNGLSPTEVQSRLQTLAKTIDSRGWAIKNVDVNMFDQTGTVPTAPSDRLVDGSSLPKEVPDYDVQASDDMLDEHNNPVAQKFDTMINASEQSHRQQLIEEMNSSEPPQGTHPRAAPEDYWFLNQPAAANLPPAQDMFNSARVVQPGSNDTAAPAGTATPDEAALAAKLKAENAASRQLYHAHLRTIQPLSNQSVGQSDSGATTDTPVNQATSTASNQTDQTAANSDDKSAQPTGPADSSGQSATPGTPQHDPAILSLANNNDLNVATLAREAYKAKNHGEAPDEVVISLH